jgi:ATP-dependent exoDNAse (exonuclease V) beta subunit
MPPAHTDRMYSFPISRVESPKRGLVVVTYADGTGLDEDPRFGTVEEFKAAIAAAVREWIDTKVGYGAYAARNKSITVRDVAELMNSRRERPSLMERLKKQGITYLEVVEYADRDITPVWSIDDNLTDGT